MASPSSTPIRFELLSVQTPTSTFKMSWRIPADLFYFEGHFPGNPVLPAVAIIDVSLEMLSQCLRQNNVQLAEIKSTKFMSPLSPGQQVEILAQKLADGLSWQIDWTLVNTPQTVAKIHLSLRG